LGGNIEDDETPKECILREMKEEIELDLRNPELFKVYNMDDRIEYTFWQKMDLDISQIRLHEGQRLKWFSEDDVKKMKKKEVAFGFKTILLDFFKEKRIRQEVKMKTKIIHTEKGDLSYCQMENESIATSSDFLETIVNCPTHTIILDKSALNRDFFELKTGVAGEFLQKVSNYKRRLVVLGNYENIKSKSLKDFIYESNKTGQVVFTKSIEEAIKLLK